MTPQIPVPTKPADHIADGVAKFRKATKDYTLAQKRVQRAQEALPVTRWELPQLAEAARAMVQHIRDDDDDDEEAL